MSTLVLGKPSEKQDMFLRAKTKYIIFGGARGGGKSWIVRYDAKLRALKYPGIKMLIVRRTYPELIKNHIRTLRQELLGIARYNDKDKVLMFPNGSTIEFTYCSCDKDLDHLQGTEFDQIYIDEATMLTEYQIKAICACLRGTGNFPHHVVLTCNPGGQGHSYIKRIAVDKVYTDDEDPNDYTFIQSKVTDNYALMEAMPDYIKQLDALPEKIRKAWKDGDWNIFDGVFFEEFLDAPSHYEDRQWTNVIDPFEIPEDWTIYRAFDWGYSKPFSVLWIAVDADNRAYVILELYGCTKTPNEGVKWTAEKVFFEIHRIETEHRWLKGKHIHGVADPAIWNAETGKSISDTAEEYRVYFSKGDNSRLNGWMQVHYRLTMDENGYPMLYIFKTCKELIRCIPLMMYDEHKVEDLDTDLEDHALDSLRYFSMSRPMSAPIKVAPDEYDKSVLSQVFEIPKSELTKPKKYLRTEVITNGTV